MRRKFLVALLALLIVVEFTRVFVVPTVFGGGFWKYKAAGEVHGVDVSADGNFTVAGTGGRTIYLFAGNGSLLWTYSFGASVECVAISENGSRIVVGIHEFYSGRPDTYLFDNHGSVLWQKDLVTGSWPTDVDISPDARYIAEGDVDDFAYFYDINGTPVWKYKTGGWVSVISTCMDGQYVAVGSQDNILYFFDKAGNQLWNRTFGFNVEAVSISPEGEYVAASTSIEEDFFLFDKAGNVVFQTQFELGVEAVSVSANAERIAVAWGYRDKVVIMNKTASIVWERSMGNAPNDVAITADGRFVAFCFSDYVCYYETLPPSEIEFEILPKSPMVIAVGESVTVNGSVTPKVSGAQVTLEYRLVLNDSIYSPEGLVNIVKTVTTLADGSFVDVFNPDGFGWWNVKAFWSGDAEHSPSEAEASFHVNPNVENSLLSSDPVTLYWSTERWYCVETFPSTPPTSTSHYFLTKEPPTSNVSSMTGFSPNSYWWLGHPEWGYLGAHTGILLEDTLIQGGLWNLSIWASVGEPDQHFGVQLCYWDENFDRNFIAFWDTGPFNTTSSDDPVLLNHSFNLSQVIIPKGSFLGLRIIVGPDSNINIFFNSTSRQTHLTIPPAMLVVIHELDITATVGGTTSPYLGKETYTAGTETNVTAYPESGYSFDHWELDGEDIGSDNPVRIVMDSDHLLLAVFVDNIAPAIGIPVRSPAADVQLLQSVNVTVTVSDSGSGVSNVTLLYSIDNGTTWISLNMSKISSYTYETVIPGHENYTQVKYKITACDEAGNTAVKDNYGYYYAYSVIPEFQTTAGLALLMILITAITLKFHARRKSVREPRYASKPA